MEMEVMELLKRQQVPYIILVGLVDLDMEELVVEDERDIMEQEELNV